MKGENLKDWDFGVIWVGQCMQKGSPRDGYTNPSGRFTPLEYWMPSSHLHVGKNILAIGYLGVCIQRQVQKHLCICMCVCVNACPICLLEADGLRWKMICGEGCSNPLHSPQELPRWMGNQWAAIITSHLKRKCLLLLTLILDNAHWTFFLKKTLHLFIWSSNLSLIHISEPTRPY